MSKRNCQGAPQAHHDVLRTCFNRRSKLEIVDIDHLVSKSLAPPLRRRIIFGISTLVLGFALVLELFLSHGGMDYKWVYKCGLLLTVLLRYGHLFLFIVPENTQDDGSKRYDR
jgi:hypothetical protein